MSTKNKKNRRVYERRRSDRKESVKKRVPGWVWLLLGAAIIFGAALILSKMKLNTVTKVQQEEPLAQSQIEEPVAPLPPKPETRFDFYQKLRDMKIFIPSEEEIVPIKNAALEIKKVNVPGAYVLQVASFKEYGMADTLKAKLAIFGITSGIQTVTIEKGATWHRVRIGPIHDLSRLHEVQAQLQQNSVEFILLKLKG